MPPTTTFFPSILIETVISFLIISVVIIPSLAAICPLLLSCSANLPTLFSIKSIFSGSPITPVDATKISSGFKFKTSAVASAILNACSNPSFPLKVFAFALFIIIACAFPSCICLLVTYIGFAFILF